MKYSIKERNGKSYLVAWTENWDNEVFSIQLTNELVKEVVDYNNKTIFFEALSEKFPNEAFSAINKSKLCAELHNLLDEGNSLEDAARLLINKNKKCKYYENGTCMGQKYAPRVNCCGDTWLCENRKEL